MVLNSHLNRHVIPLLLLLSVLAFVVNHYLPPKRLVLHPQELNQNNIYGYTDPQTGQSSRWIDRDAHEWECSYKPEHPYGCGGNIGWGKAADEGIDLSKFDTLEFKMEYEGTSTRLRVAMHNFNEAYSSINDPGSGKHMSFLVNPQDIRDNILRVKLADFNVSKWWVKDRRIHRRWASRELDNIVQIGVEVVEPSENRVKIEGISASGPWLESQTFLYIVVFAWMAFFLSHGLIQFYQVYSNSQQNRQQIRELLKKQEDLEVEKQYLSDIAKIDPLTEVYNRNGFLSRLEELAPGKRSPNNNLAILLLDLDHFKFINDNYGHDFGDAALKVFASAIKQSIRDQDIFARWGGEEFILVCKVANKAALRGFAEKLRRIIENTRVDSNTTVAFTVSIGIAWFQQGEQFDEVLKRADVALYQAKQGGEIVLPVTCKFLLLFALLSSVLCYASVSKPVFHPLQLEERTRTDFAYSSLKDEEGFLWIATDYGLRRYDGYQLRTFLRDENDPNSLGSTGAFALLLHSSGNLWASGTMLSRYNADTETFNNFPIADSKPVLALEEDNEGHIWLGGSGFGLVRFDPVSEKVLDVYFKDEVEGRINDLLMHSSGNALWVASSGGVYLFDFASKKAKKYPLQDEIASESFSGQLAQDADGNLWVATHKGLFVLDENSGVHKHYSAEPNSKRALKTNKLSAIKIDAKGQIWVGTDKEGVYRYQPETDDFLHVPSATFTDGMLPPGQIFDIYEDDKGSLWFSVGPYGVYRLSESYEKFSTYKNSPEFSNSLSFNNVLGMLEDNQGKVWIATDGGGLNLFDPEEAVFTHYFHDSANSNSISTNTVLTLGQDESGTIWIGTWDGGLNRFDPKTGIFKRYLRNPHAAKDNAIAVNNVFDIEVMADGRLLLSVWGQGIQIFNPATEKFKTFVEGSDNSKLVNTIVNHIRPSNDGNYWISGYGGVEKYFPESERVVQMDLALKDGAFNVYEDKNDTLWIATPSGLIRYMPYVNNVKHYSTREGLSDNFVVGVEEDSSGYLWVSTRNGLSRFDPETETFEVFDKNDGLASSHFNRGSHLKTRDGYLYFGSTDGLVVFNPEQLPRNEYAPTVHFLGLELFQKPLLPGTSSWLPKPLNRVEQLTLPYDQRDITFLFTALNFINPEKNRFRYRLLGLEEDWLETNSRGRRVRYTNLAPGDYSFQLLSANNDGVWNGSARELKLTIKPAWWQTRWATAVYILLAILGVYLYGRWQIRQNLQREKQLQLLVDEQTAQLRRANRTVVQINSELEQRVAHRTQELSQEIEDRRESEARVAYIAYHDPLTGLYNRVWLLNHLEELIDNCSKTKYCVFYIGGDRFKKINDMHGPLVGDALLKSASERIKNLIPEDYLIVRLGGDEFAVIIDHYTPDLDAEGLGRRICDEFKNKFQIDKLNIAFGVSVGIVIGNGEYTESTHILRDANIAMQRAKENGRGICQIFDEKMLEATLENAALESALRNALANNEFSVVYQPIIAMQSQKLDGFELLLRWTHPDLGMVPPVRFISIAESIGLIFDIGIWVIRQACLQLMTWKELVGEENVPNISVNLSPLQLGQDDLLPLINSVLKETGAPIDKIKLEITESALMLDTGVSDKLLDELRHRGFELAIDDFGTGYSSLSYLDRLPVQVLKIDRAFVNALFEEDREAGSAHEIVRATINLAHSLQMRVVAEGIETPQQLETLKTYDCDFGQGYYIAKPMPAENATEFLQNYLDTL